MVLPRRGRPGLQFRQFYPSNSCLFLWVCLAEADQVCNSDNSIPPTAAFSCGSASPRQTRFAIPTILSLQQLPFLVGLPRRGRQGLQFRQFYPSNSCLFLWVCLAEADKVCNSDNSIPPTAAFSCGSASPRQTRFAIPTILSLQQLPFLVGLPR